MADKLTATITFHCTDEGKRIIKTEQHEVLTVDCKPNTATQPPHLAALAAMGMVKSVANGVGV